MRAFVGILAFATLLVWVLAVLGPFLALLWLVLGMALGAAWGVTPSPQRVAALLLGILLGWAALIVVAFLECLSPNCHLVGWPRDYLAWLALTSLAVACAAAIEGWITAKRTGNRGSS